MALLPITVNALEVCMDCEIKTLQEAIEKVKNYQTITVTKPGTYDGISFSMGKLGITITAKDQNNRDAFIIDGGGNDTVVKMGGGWTLQGFTITGGFAPNGRGGGGITLGQVNTIRNCVIRDNIATGGGGGIYSITGGTDLTLVNSKIHDNKARFGGGIVTVANLTLINTDVFSNKAIPDEDGSPAPHTGGIWAGADLTIKDSQIYQNTVTGDGGVAGGIHKSGENRPVRIVNSHIWGNVSSGIAGGLRFTTGDVVITGGSIFSNMAASTGGGVQISGGMVSFSGVLVFNNTAPTDGGGIYCSGSGVLRSFSGGKISGNTVPEKGGSCADPQCTFGQPDISCDTGMAGACTEGSRSCDITEVWSECTPIFPVTPKEVNCRDGIDNDCDASTDDLELLGDEDCEVIEPTAVAVVKNSGSAEDPVNTLTGALYQSFPPDLNLGGPLPLSFSRYYDSGLAALGIGGRLGDNWRHNFEWSLVDDTGTTGFVEVTSPRGRRISFELVSGSFELRGLLDVRYQLADTGSTFTLGDPRTGMLYVFDATGKLVSMSDGTSNGLTLSYSGAELESVTDGLDRTLTFTYTSGDLTGVSDGTRDLDFGYTSTDLTSFTDARAKTTTYTFDPGGLMTSWTLPRGNTPYIQTWDGSDRVATQIEAPSNTHTFSYNDVTRVTTMTDPESDTRAHIHSPDGQLTDVESEDGQNFNVAYNSDGDTIGVTDRFGDSTAITTHQLSGKRASITHADGTTTSYSYLSRTVSGITFHDLSRIDYPDGTFEELLWSNSGDLVWRQDRAGHSWSYIYNDRGQLENFTNPSGGETISTYNGDGTLASRTDPSGNTTSFDYDALKRLILITRPDTTTLSFTYDNANNLLTVTDERFNTTTATYDDNGNLESITDPLNHTTSYDYDDVDRLTMVTDALGNPATLTYDTLGRVATATDRAGDSVTFGYDPRGRLTSVTDGISKLWQRGWDVERVPTSATDPLGNTVTLSSDKMGRITQLDTPLGHSTARIFDSMGRVVQVTDPVDEITDLSYDTRGLLSSITRGGLNTTIARNSLGRITSVTDANGQSWLQLWDDQGRLTSRTDPLTNEYTFTHNNRNRVNLVTFPGAMGTLMPTYDGVGNLTRRLYSDATDLNFIYDNADRLTSAEGLSLAYDANDRLVSSNDLTMNRDLDGRLETLTLAPGKTVTYSYDARGLLEQVTDWVDGAAGITTFSYDDALRLTTITRPNGVDTTLGYDADSRLVTMSEGALSSSSLTYDAAGKITRAERIVPTAGDPAGATPTSHSYDAASQVAGFTYDALGRLTVDGTRSYVWDLASRLISVTQTPDTVTYTYDALGSRVTRAEAAVTRGYVWNYALGLPSVNVERQGGVAGSDLRYYVTTPGGLLLYSREAADDARRDYHYDQIGNTLFLTDAAGAVVASYAYDPYGQLLASTGEVENLFTWQGGFGVMSEKGATDVSDGLYYLRARYYDSGTRRFLSRDPVPTLDPATVNPYQYAAGAPTRFVDPLGLLSLAENTFIKSTPVFIHSIKLRLNKNGGLRKFHGGVGRSWTEMVDNSLLQTGGHSFTTFVPEIERFLNSTNIQKAYGAQLVEAPSIQPLSGLTCGVASNREALLKALEKERQELNTLKAKAGPHEQALLESLKKAVAKNIDEINLAQVLIADLDYTYAIYNFAGKVPSTPGLDPDKSVAELIESARAKDKAAIIDRIDCLEEALGERVIGELGGIVVLA